MPEKYQGSKNLQQDSDNRYFPRWEVQKNTLFSIESNGSTFLPATTKDLSCAGACLALSKYIAPNQKINMTIFLTENKYVHMQGQVVWVHNTNGELEAGVAFYNTSPMTQELLLEHAFELDKNDIKKRWFKGWKD